MQRDHFDTLILGGGAAGCVLAARLSEDADRRVCLVEAGPDYGPLEAGRWPADLLDGRDCATSHDWGYGVDTCCRVIGGSSSHNGCLAIWGTPADYDEWAALTGEPGWGFAAFRPYLERVDAAIRSRPVAADEVGPWTHATLAAADTLGYGRLAAFNDPAAIEGAGIVPVNRVGSVRFGAAFAYLDAARTRPNLTIRADSLVDRVEIAAGRARGATLIGDGRPERVRAAEVIVTAGAYGTPAILLRSGIGPVAELQALGIDVVVDLPVGRGLTDHPCAQVEFAPSAELEAALRAGDADGTVSHVQAKLKARSRHSTDDSFDLHVLPNTRFPRDDAPFGVSLIAVQLRPRSRGVVSLRSLDPTVVPGIDRRLFSDPDGHDAEVLTDGLELIRRLAATAPIAGLAIEQRPGSDVVGDALGRFMRASASALYHPTGTCRMGAVTDAAGRVRGVEGLRVGDASLMPAIPRGNTHVTVLAIAERLADLIRGR